MHSGKGKWRFLMGIGSLFGRVLSRILEDSKEIDPEFTFDILEVPVKFPVNIDAIVDTGPVIDIGKDYFAVPPGAVIKIPV